MATEKGNISIHAQNIMPIIKRWLYSDKDIFLRELVSNANDAITKHTIVAGSGGAEAESSYAITIELDPEKRQLRILDNGIGMTEEEVRKYITQVAFSGAEEFLKQYKPDQKEDAGIIGHFGLGFYSAFMVSTRVEIDTLSYQPGATAVHWASDDGMEYEIGEGERVSRGTTICLTLAEDAQEFTESARLRQTIEKYCAFMPVPIYLIDLTPKPAPEKPEDDGELRDAEDEEHECTCGHEHGEDHECTCGHEHGEDHECTCGHEHGEDHECTCGHAKKGERAPEQVNDTVPLWRKAPKDVTDDEYREFYKKLFHDFEPPLFWIHLNAEYPFNLKGILYFPKLRQDFTINEGQIKLYSNQVFVADNIKEIIPEFLLLLKGAIDCPDLPLNVSRSFLQNDGYVKKVSAYITRKVGDRLVSEFNTQRASYEKYWDDIHPFVKYGCIRDAKFYERVKDALLFKTSEGEYLTLKEYQERNPEKQAKTVYYCADPKRQAQPLSLYRQQGIDVVVLDTMIDNNFMSHLEYSAGGTAEERVSFKRIDADLSGLAEDGTADEATREALEKLFRASVGDESLKVTLSVLKNDTVPAIVVVDEQSRRFAEMSKAWGGGFAMPEQKTLALNEKSALIDYLKTLGEGERARLLCKQIFDLAEMGRQPLESERMSEFIARSYEMMAMIANGAE